MSQENVDRALRVYDAVNVRDLEGLLALIDKEVVLIPILAAVEGEYHGHPGIRRWWDNVLGAIPDYTIDVAEVRAHGDWTLGAIRVHGEGSGSGVPVDERVSQAIEWRDGKALRFVSFRTEAEALEAVGLSE